MATDKIQEVWFMNDDRLLFQLKSLEKSIIRYLITEDNSNFKKMMPITTPTQMQIMEIILKTLEDVYQKDLEEKLNLRRATVSGVLQTMEKNNLITRVCVSSDARAKKIILNKKAKEIFLSNQQKLVDLEKIITKDISSSDLQLFSKIIKTMKENIKNIDR